ncbi:pseudouridine synthase [Micavibrio aeruginosavorus]|uniref:Pseudouridine synthase n=1 Tax=Micavibrio aeruginosavorus EPB TaxID=349215 RepID=M4VEZ7_9BACT|nr:pseudouridine synthase [Micavibrio aeruginosavorus]AGH97045.1 tRNA pseudouridine synthase A [Micavibrio aeruginosavorus EPB]
MNDTPKDGERIAKVMARAGLCSRREAESWITAGRVRVNGKTLDSPACLVGPDDQVVVDNKPLPTAQATRLFLYHKPAGLVTSARDELGRPTVFDMLPPAMPRVVSVGRLDLTTEGLLLLTNDGGLSRHLELPATGWKRRYRVRVYGTVNEKKLIGLKDGITVDGVRYGAIEATLEEAQTKANSWLSVTLTEGKNREIRRVMEALDLQVTRLIRVSYGPFRLGKLNEGAVEEVPLAALRELIPTYFNPGAAQTDTDIDGVDAAPRTARTHTGAAPAKNAASRKGWAKAKPDTKVKPRKTRKPAGKAGGPGGKPTGGRSGKRP